MYCTECDNVGDGLDEYRGLGLVPLVGAALASPTVKNVVGDVGGAIVGGIKSIFGGGAEDKPSGWEQEALTGRVRCPEGGQFTYAYLDPSRRIPGHPGYRAGQYYGVSVDDLEAALERTPQGRPGDAMFTREALFGVLRAVAPSVPRPANIRELAQAAVYIAHGKGDCKIGSSESPVAEHIDAIFQRYSPNCAAGGAMYGQQGCAGASPTAAGPAPGTGYDAADLATDLASPGELLESMGTVARANPTVVLGVMGGLLALAAFASAR